MVLYFRHLLSTANLKQEHSTRIVEDNMGTGKLSRSVNVNDRTKHIDIKFHDVRSLVKDNVVNVQNVSTKLQTADVLTQRWDAVKVLRSRMMLMGN